MYVTYRGCFECCVRRVGHSLLRRESRAIKVGEEMTGTTSSFVPQVTETISRSFTRIKYFFFFLLLYQRKSNDSWWLCKNGTTNSATWNYSLKLEIQISSAAVNLLEYSSVDQSYTYIYTIYEYHWPHQNYRMTNNKTSNRNFKKRT